MKIRDLFIERFGALRDYEVRDLPDGLTVFVGPNGTGKSSLFGFLRQMLFGSGGDEQPSVTGSQHSNWAGRLRCASGNAVYTIARQAGCPPQMSVTQPDREGATAAVIPDLFGGADDHAIASLLTFDSQDLQTPVPLSAPGLRERLRPVGGGRLTSIRRALETILARKSEVAQRAGSDPQRAPARAMEVQARIAGSMQAAGRARQLLETQAQTRLTLDSRAHTISELKAEAAKYTALIELSPVWRELDQARHELETTESIEEFPDQAEGRLERALAAREAAQRTVEQLDGPADHSRREIPVVIHSEPPETPGGGFDAVVREPVLGGFPAPASIPADALAWQQRWKDAAEAVCDRERALDATTRAVRELEAVRAEIAATLSRPEPPSSAVLDEETRLFQHVNTTLNALADDQAASKRWQDVIAERGRMVRALESEPVTLPSKLSSRAGWVAAAIGGTVAGFQLAGQDPVTMGVLIVCSVATAAGAAVQRRRLAAAFEEDATQRARLAELRGELEEGCQNLLRHQERATRGRFDISVDCARLGLPPMPSEQQLQEREAELEKHRHRRRDWDLAQTSLADTLASLNSCEELRRQHALAFQEAQDHERQTIQQWYEWKARAVDTHGAVHGSAESVRAEAELLDNCRRLKIQISEYGHHSATAWNTSVRSAVAGAGGNDSLTAVAPVTDEQSPALLAARRRLRQCEESLALLFSQAGASDESAFRERLAIHRRRLALAQTIRTCEMRSRERLKGEPAADDILRALPESHVDEWGRRAARAAQELGSVEADRDETLQQLRRIDADLRDASAESANLSALEVERSGWAADALATNRDWRTLAIAASVLEETQRHFERENVPPALRRASETMAAVAGSRYERLGQSDDLCELRVFDSTSGWKPVSQLSRGTIAQIQFSLRLGLAEEPTAGGPWPLVIDDVLEQFDPKRGRVIASRIVELSRRHQIIVFTRRPETCELFRSMDPKARVIALQEV